MCEQCAVYEEQLRRIKRAIVPRLLFPEEWKLNRGETSTLAALYSSPDGFRSNEMLKACALIFSGSISNDPSVVSVRIHQLRMKLPPAIKIITRHAEGYYLPPESKALIRDALEMPVMD
jgi:DNA-binding response OmpR family regulator